MNRGQMIHIAPRQDDPPMNPWSPSYNPANANYGHITGHNDNPTPRTENP